MNSLPNTSYRAQYECTAFTPQSVAHDPVKTVFVGEKVRIDMRKRYSNKASKKVLPFFKNLIFSGPCEIYCLNASNEVLKVYDTLGRRYKCYTFAIKSFFVERVCGYGGNPVVCSQEIACRLDLSDPASLELTKKVVMRDHRSCVSLVEGIWYVTNTWR